MSEQHARILLVDDYPDALEMWGLYLRLQGYDVITATNGPDALTLARTAAPDLIVIDLELPGLSGIDVARALHASPDTAGLKLIAATGCADPSQLEEAGGAGFEAILIKPCEPDVLIRAIELALGAAVSLKKS